MSKTRGEGRSDSEKSERVIVPAEVRRAEAAKRRKEEEDWAARSGPVVTRTSDAPRKYTGESGKGRFDKDGNEWFACDPYPTWYRWVSKDDRRVLLTTDTKLVYAGRYEEEFPKFPGWRDDG